MTQGLAVLVPEVDPGLARSRTQAATGRRILLVPDEVERGQAGIMPIPQHDQRLMLQQVGDIEDGEAKLPPVASSASPPSHRIFCQGGIRTEEKARRARSPARWRGPAVTGPLPRASMTFTRLRRRGACCWSRKRSPARTSRVVTHGRVRARPPTRLSGQLAPASRMQARGAGLRSLAPARPNRGCLAGSRLCLPGCIDTENWPPSANAWSGR